MKREYTDLIELITNENFVALQFDFPEKMEEIGNALAKIEMDAYREGVDEGYVRGITDTSKNILTQIGGSIYPKERNTDASRNITGIT